MGSKINFKSISKDNSEALAFVIECLFSSVVTLEELNKWALSMLEVLDEKSIPFYIYELIDFNQPLVKIFDVIGFTPVWEHSKSEAYALYGLAVQRGFQPYDMNISTSEAMLFLNNNPHVKEMFNQIFPFINID